MYLNIAYSMISSTALTKNLATLELLWIRCALLHPLKHPTGAATPRSGVTRCPYVKQAQCEFIVISTSQSCGMLWLSGWAPVWYTPCISKPAATWRFKSKLRFQSKSEYVWIVCFISVLVTWCCILFFCKIRTCRVWVMITQLWFVQSISNAQDQLAAMFQSQMHTWDLTGGWPVHGLYLFHEAHIIYQVYSPTVSNSVLSVFYLTVS